MDRIFIEGLETQAIIGVHEWERHNRQKVVIDIEVFRDTGQAAEHDDLEATTGYGDIARAVTEAVEASEFRLIETLADHLANLIFREFAPPRLTVTVSKPGAVDQARNVGITIERDRP